MDDHLSGHILTRRGRTIVKYSGRPKSIRGREAYDFFLQCFRTAPAEMIYDSICGWIAVFHCSDRKVIVNTDLFDLDTGLTLRDA